MTVPFRVEPESSKRPAQQDPFLEFESERPSASQFPQEEPWKPTALPEPAAGATVERRESAINPTVAFALAVAGLVTATVGYYQMGQVLAGRSQFGSATQATAPAAKPAPTPTTGRLEIGSDPLGASVTVDGVSRGATPLTLTEVKAGRHDIVISRGASVVKRAVDIAAGGTSNVTAVMTAPPPPAAPPAAQGSDAAAAGTVATGWVTLDSPIEFQVFEQGKARGTTRSGRIQFSAGPHQLELVNAALEIRQPLSASVVTGRSTSLHVPLPNGLLSVNALPWAEVFVDGTAVGTTPLANLSLPVGPHQVVVKHPTLGERQESVVVKAVTPARLGLNLNR